VPLFWGRNSSDRLYVVPKSGGQHHLHRKTQVLPSELTKAHAFVISQSYLQCFSHEDGCSLPVINCRISLSEQLRRSLFGTDVVFIEQRGYYQFDTAALSYTKRALYK
jgi:hypothetical protein